MFKELSQLTGLLKDLPRIKEEVQKVQQRLGQIVTEGDAGGGMVKLRMNGRFELIGCTLSDEVFKLNDREMLEDLIRAAHSQALEKARQAVSEETSKLTAGLNFPGMPDIASMLGQ